MSLIYPVLLNPRVRLKFELILFALALMMILSLEILIIHTLMTVLQVLHKITKIPPKYWYVQTNQHISCTYNDTVLSSAFLLVRNFSSEHVLQYVHSCRKGTRARTGEQDAKDSTVPYIPYRTAQQNNLSFLFFFKSESASNDIPSLPKNHKM